MPTAKTAWNPGEPWRIVLSCGHRAIFNLAPPKEGDVILCYACERGATVILREAIRKDKGAKRTSVCRR